MSDMTRCETPLSIAYYRTPNHHRPHPVSFSFHGALVLLVHVGHSLLSCMPIISSGGQSCSSPASIRHAELNDQEGLIRMYVILVFTLSLCCLKEPKYSLRLQPHHITLMDQDLNQEIALCEAVVSRVKDLLTSGSNSWRSCLETVRTTITTLENSAFLSSPSLLDEQVKLVSTFQKLAYQEPDNGGEVDIASWCVRQWATMLQRHPNSLDSLKGRSTSLLILRISCPD